MSVFEKFKLGLKRTAAVLQAHQGGASHELDALIESADDWDSLERRLVELRTRARKRQQEIAERLAPLAKRVEALLCEGKQARVKVVRQNLLRQADSYMREIECEDEAAKVHSANCVLLTDVIKQVRRARAMGERGIEAEALDMIGAQLEEIVEAHASAFEAADELEASGALPVRTEASGADVARRLESVRDNAEPDATTSEANVDVKRIQNRLYAETA